MSELNENFVRDMLACTDPEGRNQHASLTVWEEHQLAYGWLHLQTLRLQLSRGKELLLQALAGLQLSATYLASRPLHDIESGVMREHALKEQMERISGLTEFLKEVGKG